MIGETLSHFRIVEKVGQGGMGVVYRGIDLDLDRTVAIKILTPEARQDKDSVGRFLREARTASKLQHPAITTIYEFGVKDDQRYLVMEFIEGKTLKEIVKDGPLPLRQALEIASQVADALSLADENGIIHRDIKPDNIMLTVRGQAKILDFGLAKMKEKTGPVPSETFHTVGNLVMGTISYMSPEQAMGAPLDSRTDIYSTGVVLFEMVTGVLPFAGKSPNIVLAKILNQPAPPASQYNPAVPRDVDDLIGRCLVKERDRRCANAAQLLAELKKVLRRTENERDWMAAPAGAQTEAPLDLPHREEPTAETATPKHVEESKQAPAAWSGALAIASSEDVAPRAAPPAVPAEPPAESGSVEPRRPPASLPLVLLGHAAFLVKALRITVSWIFVFYALGCVLLFIAPFFPRDEAEGLMLIHVFRWAIFPLVSLIVAEAGITFFYGPFNFLFVGLALAAALARMTATFYLEQLESRLRRLFQQPRPQRPIVSASVAAAVPSAVTPPAPASRVSLLRDYAAAKRMLAAVKKELAFLAMDIADFSSLRLAEDKSEVERAFISYRQFVENVVMQFRVYRMTWTQDGLMACFAYPDDAVAAARGLLAGLEEFNRDGHHLRNPFRIRCGVNFGEVLLPDTKPLEDVSDEAVDLAGHLQKQAEPNSLWISDEVYSRLLDRSGFTRLEIMVDNHGVFAWRKPPARAT